MNIRPIQQVAALALSLLVTLGTLGLVDHLASSEPASAQWAGAVTAPRG